jgi:hypothetical protein
VNSGKIVVNGGKNRGKLLSLISYAIHVPVVVTDRTENSGFRIGDEDLALRRVTPVEQHDDLKLINLLKFRFSFLLLNFSVPNT